MSLSDCHQPASNASSQQSRSWEKRMKPWSPSRGTREGRRRCWLCSFISQLKRCKIAHGLSQAMIPWKERKMGNFTQGLSNPSFQHMFCTLPHTHGWRENSSFSELWKWKQHEKLQTVNFIFLSHSMAIPEGLLLLTLVSFLLSDYLGSRH